MAVSKSAARLGQGKKSTPVDEKPGCAFGMVTRKGLDDLSKDFERLEVKINGIIFGVVMTIILEVWKTLK